MIFLERGWNGWINNFHRGGKGLASLTRIINVISWSLKRINSVPSLKKRIFYPTQSTSPMLLLPPNTLHTDQKFLSYSYSSPPQWPSPDTTRTCLYNHHVTPFPFHLVRRPGFFFKPPRPTPPPLARINVLCVTPATHQISVTKSWKSFYITTPPFIAKTSPLSSTIAVFVSIVVFVVINREFWR